MNSAAYTMHNMCGKAMLKLQFIDFHRFKTNEQVSQRLQDSLLRFFRPQTLWPQRQRHPRLIGPGWRHWSLHLHRGKWGGRGIGFVHCRGQEKRRRVSTLNYRVNTTWWDSYPCRGHISLWLYWLNSFQAFLLSLPVLHLPQCDSDSRQQIEHWLQTGTRRWCLFVHSPETGKIL